MRCASVTNVPKGRRSLRVSTILFVAALFPCAFPAEPQAQAQAPKASSPSQASKDSSSVQGSSAQVASAAATSLQHWIDLAAQGLCQESLPALKKSLAHIPDKDLRYHAAMAAAKCAMSLEQTESAVQALLLLNRDFPQDPEVLYITTHYFSQLAARASQQLASSAPSSYQAHELDAEGLESQSRWDEAAAEYHRILEQNSNVPGIHFRLGRIALDRGNSPENTAQAKSEFEQELKIDPNNASAEFSLGEIARRAGQWDEAAPHFTQAAKLDAGFAEAYLALGMTLSSAEQFAQAVSPLERYVKMVPSDPAGHYQLAIAYARIGRKPDADRELAIQRQIAAKMQASRPARSDHPPE